MQEVERYHSKSDLVAAIDNGGRFYNVWSQASDNLVTRGELAKAAGVWASDQNAFLFLELATQGLEANDKASIIGLLEPSLRDRFTKFAPKYFAPSEVDEQGQAGDAVVLEGSLEHVGDKSQFSGFIYTPIMVGQVTTFTMTPIFDCFDVYKLIGDSSGPNAVLAVPLKSPFSDGQQVRVGGYLRQLEFEDAAVRTNKYYLEAVYWARIP